MPAKAKKRPASTLPSPSRRIHVGAWVEVSATHRGTASFGELEAAEEPDARLYGRVTDFAYRSPASSCRIETVYVSVLAAAHCSYGHYSDDSRPLPYTPGHAGLTADLPRNAVELVVDPRTLGWLELIAGETDRAKAVRRAEAEVDDSYYRGAQLMLTTESSAVQFHPLGGAPKRIAYAPYADRRHVDYWRSLPLEDLEYEPEVASEAEFEVWEFCPAAGDPELLDGLRLLWELA